MSLFGKNNPWAKLLSGFLAGAMAFTMMPNTALAYTLPTGTDTLYYKIVFMNAANDEAAQTTVVKYDEDQTKWLDTNDAEITSVTAPSALTPAAGYTFDGWDCDTTATTAEVTPASDFALATINGIDDSYVTAGTGADAAHAIVVTLPSVSTEDTDYTLLFTKPTHATKKSDSDLSSFNAYMSASNNNVQFVGTLADAKTLMAGTLSACDIFTADAGYEIKASVAYPTAAPTFTNKLATYANDNAATPITYTLAYNEVPASNFANNTAVTPSNGSYVYDSGSYTLATLSGLKPGKYLDGWQVGGDLIDSETVLKAKAAASAGTVTLTASMGDLPAYLQPNDVLKVTYYDAAVPATALAVDSKTEINIYATATNTTDIDLNKNAKKPYYSLAAWTAKPGSTRNKGTGAALKTFSVDDGNVSATVAELSQAIGNKWTTGVVNEDGSFNLALDGTFSPNTYTLVYNGKGGKDYNNANATKYETTITINNAATPGDAESDFTFATNGSSFDFRLKGKELKGWSLTDGGSAVEDGKLKFSELVSSELANNGKVNVYAVWADEAYDATYVAGPTADLGATGPKFDGSDDKIITYNSETKSAFVVEDAYTYGKGYTLQNSTTPVWADHTFLGWSLCSSDVVDHNKHKIKDGFEVKKINSTYLDDDNTDQTFYAQWDQNYQDVVFDLNGYKTASGNNYEGAAIKYKWTGAVAPNVAFKSAWDALTTADQSSIIKANSADGGYVPQWKGHFFLGWFDNATDANTFAEDLDSKLSPIGSIAELTEGKTYYASWRTESYVIQYKSGTDEEIEGAVLEETVKYTDTIQLPDATTLYKKPGWKMNYWDYSGCTANRWKNGVTIKVSDIVDDGKANGRTGFTAAKVSNAGKVQLVAAYASGDVEIDFANLTNEELKAVREAIDTMDAGAHLGITAKATVVKTGDTLTLDNTTNPVRKGQTFAGWYKSASLADEDRITTGALDSFSTPLKSLIDEGKDFTVYPKFVNSVYSITYQDDQGVPQTKTIDPVVYPGTATLGTVASIGAPLVDTASGNNTFYGWRINGTGKTYPSTAAFGDLIGDGVLKAISDNNWNGAYDTGEPLNGGNLLVARYEGDYYVKFKNGTDTKTAEKVDKLTDALPGGVFTKAGATLTGWKFNGTVTPLADADGNAKTWDDLKATGTWYAGEANAITVEAYFEDSYNVILQDKDGKEIAAFTFLQTTDASKKIYEKTGFRADGLDVKVTGYVFDGFANEKGTKKYKLDAQMSTLISEFGSGTNKVDTVTLKAAYTPAKYQVVYHNWTNLADALTDTIITTVDFTWDKEGTLIDGANTSSYSKAKRAGYEFKEWNTDEYGVNGNVYAGGATVKNIIADATKTTAPYEQIHLYAMYVPKTYTVVLDPNEAQLTKQVNGKFETKLTGKATTVKVTNGGKLPKNTFAAPGMKFEGWTTKTATTVTVPDFGDEATVASMVATLDKADETKLYGVWSVANYEVTYVTNSATPMAKTTYTSAAAATLANPTNESGYTFGGWFTDANFAAKSILAKNSSGYYEIPKNSAGNVTVYAKWDAKDTTITFNANDGGTTAEKTQTMKYKVPTALNKNSFKNKGYVFGGWHVGSPTATLMYNDGETIQSTGNTTLYADWKKTGDSFSITLYLDDYGANAADLDGDWKNGTTPTEDKYGQGAAVTYNGYNYKTFVSSYVYGTAEELPVPTRTHYTFTGWIDKATGKVVSKITKTTTQNLTLIPGWKGEKCTITWDSNAAQVNGTVKGKAYVTDYEYGADVNIPTSGAYTANGWRIIGWSETPSGDIVNGHYPIVENKTLYAQWENIAYTVVLHNVGNAVGNGPTYTALITGDNYDADSDATGDTITYTYYIDKVAKKFTLASPTREGYTFGGWFSDANLKKSMKTVSAGKEKKQDAYAKWIANVTINFYDDAGVISSTQYVSSKQYNSYVKLNKSSVTKDKNIFSGWSLNPAATEPMFFDQSKIRMSDYDNMAGGLQVVGTSNGGNVVLNLYPVFADATKSIYTVTLRDGATGVQISQMRYTVGVGLKAKELKAAAPAKVGYSFAYWSTVVGEKTYKVTSVGKKAVGDLVLYSNYNGGKATIVYDASAMAQLDNTKVKGSLVQKQKVTIGKKFAVKNVKLKAPGYTLLGWTFDKTETNNAIIASNVYEDIDWNNDGVVADYTTVNTAQKKTVTVPEKNTFTGYFANGVLAGDLAEYDAAFDPSASLVNTLYPIWARNEYQVIVDMTGCAWTGGVGLVSANVANANGTTFNYTAKDGDIKIPYKNGYTFKGWKIWNLGYDKKGNMKWSKLGKSGIFNSKYVTQKNGVAVIQPQWKLTK